MAIVRGKGIASDNTAAGRIDNLLMFNAIGIADLPVLDFDIRRHPTMGKCGMVGRILPAVDDIGFAPWPFRGPVLKNTA